MGVQSFLSTPFSRLPSVQFLKKLAERPLDLREDHLLSKARIKNYFVEAINFKLLFATERVTDEVVEALYRLADERRVLEKMEQMQGGEVLNYIEGFPSENRAVLHTATRDFFDERQRAKVAREAAELAWKEVKKLEQFLSYLEEQNNFHNLVVIGIGGSELGPKALYLALETLKRSDREVFFIGNIDPDDTAKVLNRIDLEKTVVCVVSKSGTTLETTVNEAFARKFFRDKNIDPHPHFIAVTSEGSPLDNNSAYLKTFHIWDWIGGRYSGTSVIGGIILGFALGFSAYMEFLAGAHAMDRQALERDLRKNIPLTSALLGIWNHNFLKIETCAIIPYSQALGRFTAHLQQLDMESNGKQIDRQGHFVDFATGPIIWGEAATNAQHSFFQLIHQGVIPICVEFIAFQESQMSDFVYEGTTSQQKLLANLFAQAIALAKGQPSDNPNRVFRGNRPSHILLGKKLTPYSLGALLAYFEHKVAFQGFLWNINSFDQEGVQLGKILANRILDQMKSGEETSFEEATAFLNHMDHF